MHIICIIYSIQIAEVCVPILNCSITIGELDGALNVDGSKQPFNEILNSSVFPSMAQNQQYTIKITSCNKYGCKSPKHTMTVGELIYSVYTAASMSSVQICGLNVLEKQNVQEPLLAHVLAYFKS